MLEPQGSSFTGPLRRRPADANDTWFRPVDCLAGPDGSVYVADWYDKRANHVDPVDNWDKTNGRIYKIEHQGTRLGRGARTSNKQDQRRTGQPCSPPQRLVCRARPAASWPSDATGRSCRT